MLARAGTGVEDFVVASLLADGCSASWAPRFSRWWATHSRPRASPCRVVECRWSGGHRRRVLQCCAPCQKCSVSQRRRTASAETSSSAAPNTAWTRAANRQGSHSKTPRTIQPRRVRVAMGSSSFLMTTPSPLMTFSWTTPSATLHSRLWPNGTDFLRQGVPLWEVTYSCLRLISLLVS